jgi:hypothetical protein
MILGPTPLALVYRRFLNVVDNDDFDRTFPRLQLEPAETLPDDPVFRGFTHSGLEDFFMTVRYLTLIQIVLGSLTLCAQLDAQSCAGLQVATAVTVPPQGGSVPFTVTAPSTCSWAAGVLSGQGLVTLPSNFPDVQTGTVTLPFTSVANKTGATLTEQLAIYDVSLITMLSPIVVFTQAPYTGAITVACPSTAATLGVPYSSLVTASGGVPPYTFTEAAPLPAGLTLNPKTGAITGTPQGPVGTLTFKVAVTDSLLGNNNSTAADCPITVVGASCSGTIDGPANVPGLSSYTYSLHQQSGVGISWSIDKSTAKFNGATDQPKVVVSFQNTQPDWIEIKATYNLGAGQCTAKKNVALVKVDIGKPSFETPGRPSGTADFHDSFLVNPPADHSAPNWVTTFDPNALCWTPTGPNAGCWNKFTSNTTPKDREPAFLIKSAGARKPNGLSLGEAFVAESDVTLTSPAEKPDAVQHIQVGFIQEAYDVGVAFYQGGLTRSIAIPTIDTVDWLTSPKGPASDDEWPWYDNDQASKTGTGTILWRDTLQMSDSPADTIPKKYNPNDSSDLNSNKELESHNNSHQDSFDLYIAARTLDSELDADRHYFKQAHNVWEANLIWPVVENASTVRVFQKDWDIPSAPGEVNVHVIPARINGDVPFLRWKCASLSCKP